MCGEKLRDAIRELLTSHHKIAPSSAGHAAHAERYVTSDGLPIGFEPDRERIQNVWVRFDSVRSWVLSDIESRSYRHNEFHISKPNHNLFGEARFKEADLICFKVKDLWQAVRVIVEVAGDSHS